MVILFKLPLSQCGVSSRLQSCHLVWGPWTRLETTGSHQDFFQRNSVGFMQESSLDAMFERWRLIAMDQTVFEHGDLLDPQGKPEGCLSCFGPPPQRMTAHPANDLASLAQVQIALTALVDVRPGFFHPETEQQSPTKNNEEIGFPGWEYQPHPNSQADGYYD